MSAFDQQLEKIRTRDGFIAAVDQSGGSTPKALRLYGMDETAWSNDDEMYDSFIRCVRGSSQARRSTGIGSSAPSCSR